MSDDSFFREVDEELRSERMRGFWSRYGKIVIAAAIAVVVAIAGERAWQAYTISQAQSTGDAYMAAVDLAEQDKRDEAIAALAELEEASSPAYAALARLRQAAELRIAGQSEEAVALYDQVAGNAELDENLRSIASIRAGMVLVDTGSAADVEARVQRLSAPSAPYRGSAHEALGLAYFKAGDLELAFTQFKTIADDEELPSSIRQRAGIMLDVIASRGGKVYEPAAASG